jgi:branched-chain amino acid transport system substrate-binding protein
LSDIFAANFTALGGSVVTRQGYTADEADFTTQLTAIGQVAPDVVFMPGFESHVPLAIQKARTIPQPHASGITATFLGADSWDNPRLLSLGGQDLDGWASGRVDE